MSVAKPFAVFVPLNDVFSAFRYGLIPFKVFEICCMANLAMVSPTICAYVAYSQAIIIGTRNLLGARFGVISLSFEKFDTQNNWIRSLCTYSARRHPSEREKTELV